MCEQFNLNDAMPEIRSILDEVNLRYHDGKMDAGDKKTNDVVPVLMAGNDRIEARPMIWGIPEAENRKNLYQVESETALHERFLRRCLLLYPVAIPVSGFYEWVKEPVRGKWRKTYFHDIADDVFYLAGFCSHFDDSGDVAGRYTILRARPNKYLMLYHVRMPLLLKKEEVRDWLSGNNISYYLNRQPFRLKAEARGLFARKHNPQN